MYDTIIIGMGPAGMSASIYAKRFNLNTLVLEKSSPGGLLNKIKIIDNYPGFPSITGSELSINMFNHINKFNINYKIEEVINIVKENNVFKVTTNKGEYTSKSVILSSGNEIKEKNTYSTCAVCDAPLYKGKVVLVIGDDSLVKDTIYLSELAKEVIICTKDKLNKDLLNKDNITIYEEIPLIKEENNMYKVKLSNMEFTTDGVFSFYKSNLKPKYLDNLNIEYDNNKIISNNTLTNIEGLFVCGDLSKKELYQVVTAVSEGAVASSKVREYLKEEKC